MQDYQSLNRHLETVEGSIPSVGLVEESEERLMDRISLYQVQSGRLQIVVNGIKVFSDLHKP